MNVMKNRKAGVAVIVVLGVLALLMVLAVAFSVTMRVERAGAANYTSALNSRQLALVGLARAIADINVATPGFYPAGDFLVSREPIPTNGPTWNSNGGGGVRLASGAVRDYIPGLLQPQADAAVSEWRRLRTADGMGGHVAYLVLNVSDLLDVNHVGGAVREGGTNAAEVVLSGFLPAVNTNALVRARAALMNAFPSPRSPYFDSLAEFRALTNIPADVFIDFSRYLPDSNRTNALYIGGTVDSLQTNATAIRTGMRNALGFDERPSPVAALQLVTNLLDYLDTNSIPGRLDGPNAESVPLLSEVTLYPAPPAPPPRMSDVRFDGRVDVETWYPFILPNRFNHQFQVKYDYTVTVTAQDAAATNVSPPFSSNVVSAAFAPSPVSFASFPSTIRCPITPSLNTYSNPTVTINISVSNMLVVLAGSTTTVDSASSVVLNFNYAGPYVQAPPLAPVSYQVTDPRLNWRQSDWVATDSATMGAVNGPALAYWQANPQFAREYPVYVSDRGQLLSPLELGNLLIPGSDGLIAPWKTFRVFDQSVPGASAPRHRLLENFTVDADQAGVKRGLVNANTLDPALLAAAFRGMPHPYGRAGDPVLGNPDADAVAALITGARSSGTVFTNITDLLELDWRQAVPAMATWPDLRMEALAAYSTGLLGVRQNLFLIVVSGSSAEEGQGVRGQQTVRTQARMTAVALVWRNPAARIVNPGPNEQRLHDCFVRFFKWIDD